jgi:hypothetical protein
MARFPNQPAIDDAGRTVLAALGLAAICCLDRDGSDLRSRCLLDGKPGALQFVRRGKTLGFNVVQEKLTQRGDSFPRSTNRGHIEASRRPKHQTRARQVPRSTDRGPIEPIPMPDPFSGGWAPTGYARRHNGSQWTFLAATGFRPYPQSPRRWPRSLLSP